MISLNTLIAVSAAVVGATCILLRAAAVKDQTTIFLDTYRNSLAEARRARRPHGAKRADQQRTGDTAPPDAKGAGQQSAGDTAAPDA